MLILGMLLVIVVLSLVILAATTVNLEARKLLSAADGAASAAAINAGSTGVTPHLPAARIQQEAETYLAESGAFSEFTGLAVTNSWVSSAGDTAHIELSATVDIPVVSWVLPAEVPITVESHARVTVTRQ